MPKLSEEQIQFFEKDLLRRGIRNPDLLTDLLDHVCCAIEAKPESEDVDNCYKEIIQSLGGSRITEIQIETEKLIQELKNPRMKKTMIYSGIASSLFIFAGSVFKIFHWPGAGALYVFGSIFLAILFFPSLFYVRFREKSDNEKNAFLTITGALAGTTICLGMLFKIMHWPYATILWVSGISLLMFGYLPVYFVSEYKKAEHKLNALINSVFIVCGCSLFIIAFTYRNSAIVMEKTYLNSKSQIIENNQLMDLNSKKLEGYLSDTLVSEESKKTSSEILKNEKELDSLMEKLQSQIILNHLELEEGESFKLIHGDWEKRLESNDLGDMENLYSNPEKKAMIDALNQKLEWFASNLKSESGISKIDVKDFKGAVKNITLDKLSSIERNVHLSVAYLK